AEEGEREDLRRRTRAVIRRLVDSAWVLVVPRGKKQLVALQLRFRGGEEHRNYLIYARMGYWQAWSLADVVKPGDLDLRQPEAVAAREAEWLQLDLAQLTVSGPQAGKVKTA